MDRSKTAQLNPTAQLALAKTNLRVAVAAFGPLDPVRRHPLASVGLALGAGFALSKMPRTRDALLRTLDRGLSWLLSLATSPLRMACTKPKDSNLPNDAESKGVP